MAETTAGAPSAAQTGIALVDRVIAAVNAATKIDKATSKPETYHVCRKLITNAAGAVLLDAATCDKVERLVQTLHLSVLAAEVDEAAKAASRLEMQQLRATIQSMKASMPSTAAARAPPAAAPRTEPAVAPPAVVIAATPPPPVAPAAAPPGTQSAGSPANTPLEPADAAAAAPVVARPGAKEKTTKKPTKKKSTKKRPREEDTSSSSSQRTGKWTPEELAYASKVKKYFDSGHLPASFVGKTLREVLAELLNCAPMRVTKKIKTAERGNSHALYVKATASASELADAAKKLATLRAAYITSLAPKAPKESKHEALRAITTPFASGDAALVAAVNKAEPVARGNDAKAQADAFDPFRREVLAAASRNVSLDAAASRLLLLVAEVLYEKKPYTRKDYDAMRLLRDKIEQLGPQAPAAVAEAANQQLVAALDEAKLALGADDAATKAKALDALRKAVTPLKNKASLDVKTHDELLRVAMGLLAAKNYNTRSSFRAAKSRLERDIKALCSDAPNAGPAPRQRRDRDDAPLIPPDAFSAGGFDRRFLDMIDGKPAAKRRKPGTAVQDEDEAQRREEMREEERWRAAAAQPGFSLNDVPQRDAMSNDIIEKVDQVCASLPGDMKMIYVGAALLERILTGDGSIGPEAISFLQRGESVLRCKKTGKRLSMPQILTLRRAGALVVVHSRSHTNGAIVDAGERPAQVGVRERMVAPADGPRAAAYGHTTPGTVANQPGKKLLYATIISLEKAADASVIRAEIKLPGAFVSIYSRRPPRRRRDVSSTAWRCRRVAAHSTHWSICTQTWSSSPPTCRR